MIHACAISIVRAVGVTKTVSHPYGFQAEILLLKPVYCINTKVASNRNLRSLHKCNQLLITSHQILPVLDEGFQHWQWFGCEETGYGPLH